MKTAFYQGGINYRLDVDLIAGVAQKLSDWEFRFCGARDPSFTNWRTVEKLPNVVNLGFLPPEEVAREAWRSDVGIIPFINTPFIVEKSLPLKAFEYVACDLPVVSVPIRALDRWPDLFALAEIPEQFAREMLRVAETKRDPALKMRRRLAAQSQDYDGKFAALQERLLTKSDSKNNGRRLSILVLYSPHALFTSTVMEHINSFGMYSQNDVYYATAVDDVDCLYDIARFDVVVIHYSVRLSLEQHISPKVAAAVAGARAHRVLFIQDEYEYTERARRWMETLNIDTVFTCIPDGQWEKIYPSRRFKRVRFLTNLTGYVPERLEKVGCFKPLSERPIHLGYRGRPLPFRFGDLAKDKYMIGYRMRQECQSRGIPHDIEVEEDKRIYGDAWYDFLSSCRAVLGSESGSNVFDDDGSIGRQIQSALVDNPWLTYEEIRERYLESHEIKVRMNQISPRVFEAAATRTALVLFEGEYSGLLQPDVHYVPLKKDFSNLESVFDRFLNVDQLEEMVDRTYCDLISSGRWSYKAFIALFDKHLDAVLPVASDMRTEVSTTLDYDGCYFGGLTNWPMASDGLREAPQKIRSRFLKDTSAVIPSRGFLDATLLPAGKRILWNLGAAILYKVGSLSRRVYRRLPGWARPTADKAIRRLRRLANRLPRPQN
jgi:hypothetical protein